jgi:hypothetical protein
VQNSNIFHTSSENFKNSLHHLETSTKAQQQKERKMMRDEYEEMK